jgi:hypothetical protein
MLWLRGVKLCPGSEPHPGASSLDFTTENWSDFFIRRAAKRVWGL